MAVLRTGEGFSAAPKSIGTELPCPLVITGEIGTTQPVDSMQIWSNSGTLTIGSGGGGGGGGSVNDLSDVFMGEVQPAGPSQVLFSLSADGGVNHWVNIDFNTIVSGAVTSALAGFPGRAAGRILAVNATDDGFEWIDPA